MPMNTINPEEVISIAEIQPEIRNLKPLPEILYCPFCDCELTRAGMQYTESISGTRWGRAHINTAERIDYEAEEDNISDSVDETLTCGECDNELDSLLYQNLEFLERIYRLSQKPQFQITLNQSDQRNFLGTTRNPKIWDNITVNGNEFQCFNKEILPTIDHYLSLSNNVMPEFNRNHAVYRTRENITEEIESEGPESHESVTSSHHQRWNQGVTYPSNTANCPRCSHTFIVDNSNDEHICPKCQHDWDPTDIIQEITGNDDSPMTIRLR